MLRLVVAHLATVPFVRSGAYFADTTAPLVQMDCVRDALEAAMSACEAEYVRPAARAASVVASRLEFPDDVRPEDSVSNVGEARPAEPRARSEASRKSEAE